jgi:hypothetical protein
MKMRRSGKEEEKGSGGGRERGGGGGDTEEEEEQKQHPEEKEESTKIAQNPRGSAEQGTESTMEKEKAQRDRARETDTLTSSFKPVSTRKHSDDTTSHTRMDWKEERENVSQTRRGERVIE